MSRSIYSTMYPQIPLSLLLIILSINSLLLSQQVVNSQPSLNHDQQEEQRILLKLKNDWGNPPSLNYPLLFYEPYNPSSMNNNSWNPSTFPNHCNWTGIICDHVHGFVTGIQLTYMNITKKIPLIICDLKNLIQIDLSYNSIPGEFPTSLYNCSKLEILVLSGNYFQGRIPDDIHRLSSLRELYLNVNNFSGDNPASIGRLSFLQILVLGGNRFDDSFPTEIGNLTNLEELILDYNMFLPSRIPPEFGKLKKLKVLSMVQTNLIGEIPETIAHLSNLEFLDLSYNNLNGTIPRNLYLLKNLTQAVLSNNNLSGEIPNNIENLNLRDLDVSNNNLNGTITRNLFLFKNLRHLYLSNNSLSGEIPRALFLLKNLTDADLSNNNLSGEIPNNIENLNLEDLDLSNNNLNGTIPRNLFLFKNLMYVYLSNNSLSGEVPRALFLLKNLTFVGLNDNNLSGEIPSNIESLNLYSIHLSNNRFSGGIPTNISRLTELNYFYASNNLFTGKIPVELTALTNLHILDLDRNQLSGEIPSGIISWDSLRALNLSRNQISGEIPPKIWSLPHLYILDLSENQISGELPLQSVNLLRLYTLNISSNKLTGKLPALFDNPLLYERSFLNNSGLCASIQISGLKSCISTSSRKSSKLSPKLLTGIVVIAAATFTVSIILILFVTKNVCKRKPEQDLATWDMTSFQELHFTESNILSNLTENNQIGSGGAGKVYRVPIDHLGNFVAVKKIWSERNLDQGLEKQFQAEVKILGSIRHNNIVKLLCCISNKVSKLLVYEYMENGSLYDWLHENNSGLSTSNDERFLDWPKRLKIAVEVAQGLSYMHDNCSPPIIHRDVKSSNILLDSDFKARIADFGLARTLTKQGEPNSASVIAGSFGYIAPEYAHTKKVNEKIDVYSFGVVLLELVTGKEANKGDEYRNLAEWAWSRFQELNSMDVLMDERVKEECYLEEMRMVFKLGMICTDSFPSARPSMKEALQILLRHGPLRPTQGLSSSSPGIQREENRILTTTEYHAARLIVSDRTMAVGIIE